MPHIDGRRRLGPWLTEWLESLPPARLRTRSRVRYAGLADHWKRDPIGDRRMVELTPEHVGAALGRMHRAGTSVAVQASALSILRMAMDAAVRSGHAGRNAARLVDAPRATPRPIEPPAGAVLPHPGRDDRRSLRRHVVARAVRRTPAG